MTPEAAARSARALSDPGSLTRMADELGAGSASIAARVAASPSGDARGDAAQRSAGRPRRRFAGRPRLEDVARVAGVSRATVSRVVNGQRRVAADIQAVVREAIATTGYVPNLAARSLVTRRTGAVIVVVSGVEEQGQPSTIDFADPFFGRVVGGMLRALRPRDVDPILMLAETDSDRARVSPRCATATRTAPWSCPPAATTRCPGCSSTPGCPP